jgi:hypothetical protein
MAWDTCRVLVACFGWKQVTLGFSSLAVRLAEARLRVVHMTSSRRWHREEAEDGRVDVMGYVEPLYPKIIISSVLAVRSIVVF